MIEWLSILLHFLISLVRTRRDLIFENLLLRQQQAVLKENGARPQLSQADRSFWVLISRIWPRGRPPIDPQIRALIRRMCEANLLMKGSFRHVDIVVVCTTSSSERPLRMNL